MIPTPVLIVMLTASAYAAGSIISVGISNRSGRGVEIVRGIVILFATSLASGALVSATSEVRTLRSRVAADYTQRQRRCTALTTTLEQLGVQMTDPTHEESARDTATAIEPWVRSCLPPGETTGDLMELAIGEDRAAAVAQIHRWHDAVRRTVVSTQ